MNDKTQTASINTAPASLNSMAKAKLGNVGRRDQPQVPPSMLVVDPTWNVRGASLAREEYWSQPHIVEYVDGLAKSYLSGSYVPPIVVEYNKENQTAIVRDGEHRYHGLMKAINEYGADIIRVEVSEFKGDATEQNLLMLRSGSTLDLTAVEKAEIINRLHAYGYEPQEIADKIGKSITYVQNLLLVYQLPIEKKRAIQLKKISYAQAIAEERGANPQRAKSVTPPKKVVREFMDVVSQFKTAPVDEQGNVSVTIPAELLNKFLANLPQNEDESQDTVLNGDLFEGDETTETQ